MRTKRTIVFTGRNLSDLFNLECVKSILKSQEGDPVLVMKPKIIHPGQNMTTIATLGDVIEELEDGTWKVTRANINIK